MTKKMTKVAMLDNIDSLNRRCRKLFRLLDTIKVELGGACTKDTVDDINNSHNFHSLWLSAMDDIDNDKYMNHPSPTRFTAVELETVMSNYQSCLKSLADDTNRIIHKVIVDTDKMAEDGKNSNATVAMGKRYCNLLSDIGDSDAANDLRLAFFDWQKNIGLYEDKAEFHANYMYTSGKKYLVDNFETFSGYFFDWLKKF